MIGILRATWPLFFGITAAVMSYGLQVPLLPVRAFDEGFDTSNTGIVMSGYYVGILLSAFVAPPLIKRVGHIKVFAAMASVASGVPLIYLVTLDPVSWFLLRTVGGLCIGGLFLVAETWLNDRCTNETRGNVLNVYFMIVLLGTGIGSLMLDLADPQGPELFILASVLISFGIVPILLSAKPAPAYEAPKRLDLIALFRKAPLGFGAFAIWGMADGALMGAGAIYADKVGLTTSEIGLFMAVISLGCLIFMWPIGVLSDRFDRTKFLVAMSLMAALAAVLCALTPPDVEWLLYGLTALFAGLTLAHFGLCQAVTNDQLEPAEMVGAGATLSVCYGIGSIFGPILATEAMEAWQATWFFYFLAAVHLLVVLYALALLLAGRLTARTEHRQPSAAVTSLAGPLATAIALETAREARGPGDGEPD